MRLAIVGSRSLAPDLEAFVPDGVTEIVSGGARGVDTAAACYARRHGIALREFLPDYHLFGSRAPLLRNDQIIAHCDCVLAFWDGQSRGTLYTIRRARERGKSVTLYRAEEDGTFLLVEEG